MLDESLGELVPVGGGDAITLVRPVMTIGRRESNDICLKVANVRAGADVAVNDLRSPDDVVSEIQSLGRRAIPCPADVSDQVAVERIADETVSKLGSLDLYVSSAVFSEREPFHSADMAGFR